MRLQLIRYESVELTEQLMRERQGEGDSPQTHCLQPGEDSVVARGADGSSEVEMSEARETDCGTREARGENVPLVPTRGAPSETEATREESVMRQLQDTAQQLGMEVV